MLNPHRFKPAVLTITMITLIQELPFAVKFYPFGRLRSSQYSPARKPALLTPNSLFLEQVENNKELNSYPPLRLNSK